MILGLLEGVRRTSSMGYNALRVYGGSAFSACSDLMAPNWISLTDYRDWSELIIQRNCQIRELTSSLLSQQQFALQALRWSFLTKLSSETCQWNSSAKLFSETLQRNSPTRISNETLQCNSQSCKLRRKIRSQKHFPAKRLQTQLSTVFSMPEVLHLEFTNSQSSSRRSNNFIDAHWEHRQQLIHTLRGLRHFCRERFI